MIRYSNKNPQNEDFTFCGLEEKNLLFIQLNKSFQASRIAKVMKFPGFYFCFLPFYFCLAA